MTSGLCFCPGYLVLEISKSGHCMVSMETGRCCASSYIFGGGGLHEEVGESEHMTAVE